ncbi:MAG: hypothetical protein IT431_05180 [Phycisphaerales bacterium]|nr:hypothetical protein [Phycisphaerales bacterium]
MNPDRDDKPRLDHFGLAPAGLDPTPYRFPRSRELFFALIRAQSCGEFLYHALDAALKHVERSPFKDDWEGFDYLEPPNGEDDELRAAIIARRENNPSHYRGTIQVFDSYHRARRSLWEAIADAKPATDGAQAELDPAQSSPLDLPTVSIRRALDDLRCAVRPPLVVGPCPAANTEENLKALAGATRAIGGWIERLRPLAEQRLGESPEPPNSPEPGAAGEVVPSPPAGSPRAKAKDPPAPPKRPVLVVEAAAVIGVRSDYVLSKLRTAKKPIHGNRGEYAAELDDLVALYPKKNKALHRWADREYPAPD